MSYCMLVLLRTISMILLCTKKFLKTVCLSL
jgi:hypothetical protein